MKAQGPLGPPTFPNSTSKETAAQAGHHQSAWVAQEAPFFHYHCPFHKPKPNNNNNHSLVHKTCPQTNPLNLNRHNVSFQPKKLLHTLAVPPKQTQTLKCALFKHLPHESLHNTPIFRSKSLTTVHRIP